MPKKTDSSESPVSKTNAHAASVGGVGRVRTKFFHEKGKPFRMRCGASLRGFTLAYETYGKLDADRSNAILVFHAMTGSQHAAGINTDVPDLDGRWTDEMHVGWWDDFIGPGKALDTRKYFVICANYLGGCYGSTGPASKRGHGRWGADFPVIRMADIVDSQIRLLDHLRINALHAAIGASIGGYLCLSLATRHPDRVKIVIPMAVGPETTVLQRLMNFEQITAIELDPAFHGGSYDPKSPPHDGLAAARRIAHKTFVSLEDLHDRARGEVSYHGGTPPFGWYEMNHPVESYLLHQGQKFVSRFDANTYLRILDAWQWFDLPQEAGADGFEDLFSRCKAQRFLVFSIDSDASFPPAEQGHLVKFLESAEVPVTWITVHSGKGHDSFLLEPDLFTPHITQILG